MAQLPYTFDPNAHEAREALDTELLPAAWYAAKIVASELKETKAKTGSFLLVRFEITEGTRAGKVFFERFNLTNPTQQAVDIAMSALASLCKFAGLSGMISDSQQLHEIPVDVLLKVKGPKGDFNASNEVKGYGPLGVKSRDAANLAKQQSEPPQFQAPPKAVGQAPAANMAPPTAVQPPPQQMQPQPQQMQQAQQAPQPQQMQQAPQPHQAPQMQQPGAVPGWAAPTQQ